MLNILVLAAGSDEAFQKEGHQYPKNLVELHGKPMIECVLDRIAGPEMQVIVCLKQTEISLFHTDAVVKLIHSSARIVAIPNSTAGAACTALLAKGIIDSDDPVLIVNGDQIIDVDLIETCAGFGRDGLDGGIITFEATHPRWSFVRLDENGMVEEAAEKRPISRNATAGAYWFRKGSEFVLCAESMISKGMSVDDRYYVCPVYNEMILMGRRVGVRKIDRDRYHSFSTPTDIRQFNAQTGRLD